MTQADLWDKMETSPDIRTELSESACIVSMSGTESGMANFTKKAIQESFLRLLMERPLSQITVKDVVADCGVNRNTFYYYFH